MSPRRYQAKLPKSAVTQTRTEAWGHRWATCENAPQSGKSPRASLRATSTLLRNMSSNRFNIRHAVYRTLRALARDQSHFHILIDIERH